jgi:putative ABC transport system permease protein
VMVASAVIVCGLGLSLGIRQKLGQELKAYGANAIVSPKDTPYIDEDTVRDMYQTPGVRDAEGQLYARAAIGNTSIELIGMDFHQTEGWRVEGTLPTGADDVLLGARLAEALDTSPGGRVNIMYKGTEHSYTVSGIAERGGPEDKALLLPIGQAQQLTGLEGRISAILLRLDTDAFQQSVAALSTRFSDLTIKTLRQVAFAEESFLGKVELLMFLVGLVVLAATSISVSSTMSATVLERIKEIGLMRAIGGTRGEIRSFYLAEGAAIGIMGGLAGFVVGALAAEAVSKGAFGSFIGIPVYLVAVALVLGLAVSVAASMGQLAGAMRQKPAVVLRGE